MTKKSFYGALMGSCAFVGLICMKHPAFAQRGGGGHGGGGFHGGGGGLHSGGAFHGGGELSRGGMRGGGFSGRSFSGQGMRLPMGRSNPSFNDRFNWGRASGPSRSNSLQVGRQCY